MYVINKYNLPKINTATSKTILGGMKIKQPCCLKSFNAAILAIFTFDTEYLARTMSLHSFVQLLMKLSNSTHLTAIYTNTTY